MNPSNIPRIAKRTMRLLIAIGLIVTASSMETQSAAPVADENWTTPNAEMSFIWIGPMNGWIGEFEVTNRQFREFRPEHRSEWPADPPADAWWRHDFFRRHSLDGDDQPVVMVSFLEAVAYAHWLTERERDAGRLPEGFAYRLPDVEEWRAFARCGTDRRYPWGDEWPPEVGNYADESWRPLGDPEVMFIEGYHDGHVVSSPVAESGRNEWGLYGVAGNAGEWVTAYGYQVPVMVGVGFNSAARQFWTPVDSVFVPWDRQGHFVDRDYRIMAQGFRLVLLPALPRPEPRMPTRDELLESLRTPIDPFALHPSLETHLRLQDMGDAASPVLIDIIQNPGRPLDRCSAVRRLHIISRDIQLYRDLLSELVRRSDRACGAILMAIRSFAGESEAAIVLDLLGRADPDYRRSHEGQQAIALVQEHGTDAMRTALQSLRPFRRLFPTLSPDAQACLTNLRYIDAAKEQWVMEQNAAVGAPVDWAAARRAIRRDLRCPSNGTYSIGPVGTLPTCSVHGALLGNPDQE